MALRVAIVEDDELTAAALRSTLEMAGDSVVVDTAATENNAVLYLLGKPHCWDVVVIDYRLAQGNGLRVLAACRVRRAGQYAVMLTAHASPELRRRCLDFSADAVFDKLEGLGPLLERISVWRNQGDHVRHDAGRIGLRPGSMAA